MKWGDAMNRCCFVVLHYQNIECTRKCIDSLCRLDDFAEIVIVDNASPNGSGKLLVKEYETVEFIHIIEAEQNLGFARGNNLGYEWARMNLDGINTILCINNDVVIEDKGFIKKISDYIEKNKCDVLGVDVYNPITDSHQNPLRNRPLEANDIKKLYFKLYKHYCIIWAKRALGRVIVPRNSKRKMIDSTSNNGWMTERTEPVLHGSCIIFCREYVKQEACAFLPDTFLYYEEDLLAIKCMKKKYRVFYYPGVSILHYEGKSTGSGLDEFNRNIYKIRESKKSLRILMQYMEEL